MELPEKFSLREVIHGHGAKGMAFYGYEDTLELGVQMEARRADGRSPFIETWWLSSIPDQSFASLAALRVAAAHVTADAAAAEAAKYPLIRSAETDECGNPCRLCERPATWPRPKYSTTLVTIATNWRAASDDCASLCDSHMEQFRADPAGLLAALTAEVAERTARAAARRAAPPRGIAAMGESRDKLRAYHTMCACGSMLEQIASLEGDGSKDSYIVEFLAEAKEAITEAKRRAYQILEQAHG